MQRKLVGGTYDLPDVASRGTDAAVEAAATPNDAALEADAGDVFSDGGDAGINDAGDGG